MRSASSRPSERGSDWFANESNDYRGKLRLALGAVGDYGYRGLVGSRNPDHSIRASVLRNQVLVHAGFALVIAERLRLGVSMPIQLHAFGHEATRNGETFLPPQHQQSAGDIRTSLDLRVAGEYGEPICAGRRRFAVHSARAAGAVHRGRRRAFRAAFEPRR